MNDGYLQMWDNWTKKRSGKPVYDSWLDNYQDILEANQNELILDLGCGTGANTLYLKEKGYQVLATDFSLEALTNVKNNIKNVQVQYLNMLEKFPLTDSSFSLIIADLSLHYFSEAKTKEIMQEIKRVLKPGGILLSRVSRTDDYDFGAGRGEKIEKNYYYVDDYAKRFFDEEDILKYFGIIGKVEYHKTQMVRAEKEYQKPKKLYEIKVIVQK